jgi:type 1 glutamine amidotransferase
MSARNLMVLVAMAAAVACAVTAVPAAPAAPAAQRKPHVVFVIGDDEYKSEVTMPPFAKELQDRRGLRCTVLLAQPDPKTRNNIPGLEALADADLAVFYLRFRELPDDQMAKVRAYLDAGKPVMALRPSTIGFKNWKEFAPTILGTPPYQYHYGGDSSTDVRVAPGAADHPILKGIPNEFHVRSWLYGVLPLAEGATPLLLGKAVGGKTTRERIDQPVAWTWQHRGGRVFYTSLGHIEDFQVEALRRLLVNAVFWCLDRPVPEPAK